MTPPKNARQEPRWSVLGGVIAQLLPKGPPRPQDAGDPLASR